MNNSCAATTHNREGNAFQFGRIGTDDGGVTSRSRLGHVAWESTTTPRSVGGHDPLPVKNARGGPFIPTPSTRRARCGINRPLVFLDQPLLTFPIRCGRLPSAARYEHTSLDLDSARRDSGTPGPRKFATHGCQSRGGFFKSAESFHQRVRTRIFYLKPDRHGREQRGANGVWTTYACKNKAWRGN